MAEEKKKAEEIKKADKNLKENPFPDKYKMFASFCVNEKGEDLSGTK